jgi:hypothetical protein
MPRVSQVRAMNVPTSRLKVLNIIGGSKLLLQANDVSQQRWSSLI